MINYKILSFLALQFMLFFVTISYNLDALSPQNPFSMDKKGITSFGLSSLSDQKTAIDQATPIVIDEDVVQLSEELNPKKKWKKRIVFILLIVSLALDGFLGISLLILTLFSLNLPILVEFLILFIDVVTLIGDFFLLSYYFLILMIAKYKKIPNRSLVKQSQKRKKYIFVFTLIFLSLFVSVPVILTPIFFPLSLILSLSLFIVGSLSLLAYLLLSYHQFISKNLKQARQNKENISLKRILIISAEPLLFFLFILGFCCIIPIFSHLTPLFKYGWLIIAFVVLLLVIPVSSEKALKTIIAEELLNQEIELELSRQVVNNIPRDVLQKDFDFILSEEFSQNRRPAWKTRLIHFLDFGKKNTIELDNDSTLLQEKWKTLFNSFYKKYIDFLDNNKKLLLMHALDNLDQDVFQQIFSKEDLKILKKIIKLLKKKALDELNLSVDDYEQQQNFTRKILGYDAMNKIFSLNIPSKSSKVSNEKRLRYLRIFLYSA